MIKEILIFSGFLCIVYYLNKNNPYDINPVETPDDSIYTNNNERSVTSIDTYEKVATIRLNTFSPIGSVRVSFNLKSSFHPYYVYGKIYKNGLPVGTERKNKTIYYATYTENISFEYGDNIELYLKNPLSGQAVYNNVFEIKVNS